MVTSAEPAKKMRMEPEADQLKKPFRTIYIKCLSPPLKYFISNYSYSKTQTQLDN